ncbi:MAG TPA: glutathione S-transferase [Sandaracinaceae bacterium]
MSGHRLVGIAYSPWSIKARWALDHHAVPYRWTGYVPMIGEPLLRARTRCWRGRVSVPVLFSADGRVVHGSWDIARFAETAGGGRPLFVAGREDAIARWNARSEVMLDAGRALSLARMLRSPRALAENVPKGAVLGRIAAPLGALAVRYVARKYAGTNDQAGYLDELRTGLDALRAALAGGDHLLGTFSYADIAMAVTLAFVSPLGPGRDRLAGEATRECWTNAELAREYADLVAWRDRIVAAFAPSVRPV